MLIELSETDKPAYNRFVAAQESGSFLQSWEWGEWQAALGRVVARFKIVDSNEQIGSVQLIKTPSLFGKYYLYAPYGPVINDKFKITNFKPIFNELIFKFPEAFFVRIEPKHNRIVQPLNLPIVKSPNIQPAKTLAIDLTKSGERLLIEMHPKTRYNIRLAQKHGVEIQDEFSLSVGHGLYVKEAVRLIVETSRRQGYKGYGAGYYESLVNFFGVQHRGELKLHIYKAVYKNLLLASGIYLDFGKTRTFLFGGSAEENKNIMAPHLMHFQAMLDAKTAGFLIYDFWGIETSRGETPGFVRFKSGFGGQVKEYFGAFDIVQNKLPYGFYKIFRYIHRLL